eukprot:jgi/Hompol1/3209/HPOL_001590-RA
MSSFAYGSCSPTNFKYSSIIATPQAIVPVKQIPLVTGAGAPLTVQGSIQILDGCSFAFKDYIFLNAGETYWYGGNIGSSDGVTVSDAQVFPYAFPTTAIFNLTQVPGRQVNYNTFNQLRLYEKTTNTLLATADMPVVSAAVSTASIATAANTVATAPSQATAPVAMPFVEDMAQHPLLKMNHVVNREYYKLHSTCFFVSAVAAYSQCNTANYPYAGRNVSFPITKVIGAGVAGQPVSVTGTITITNGCGFSVSGFSFTGAPSASWFGGVGGSALGVRLTTDKFPAATILPNQTYTYTFISTVGNWISYTDFTQFRLFDEDHQLLIAIGNIPNATNPITAQPDPAPVNPVPVPLTAVPGGLPTLTTTTTTTTVAAKTSASVAASPANKQASSGVQTRVTFSTAVTAPLALMIVVAATLL